MNWKVNRNLEESCSFFFFFFPSSFYFKEGDTSKGGEIGNDQNSVRFRIFFQ